MHIRRALQGFAAATSVATVSLLGASPASAYPTWQTVGSTNSNWHCGTTIHHPASNNVNMRMCIVMNASKEAQAVLVVVNHASVAVKIEAPGIYTTWGAGGYCNEYPLAPGAQRACFTNTWPLDCSQDTTYAVEYLKMNGISGPVSNRVTTPC
ncbi:hypothetical protein [Streptomyces olivochromogenes]|uniref:hypothetical protein n=1 Tax=Streptomyces olivochromogenes TaxID=1963 RepID=UPI001F3D6976|nr:hypothetical protein [Streptomyces olivochromogenes]MCF3136184.1 hypothetical protein [Streptomyces olivochromogenes]